MTERLRGKDLAVLARETARTPMHNATVEIFEPGASGFDYDSLVAHIDDRIAFVPRYRQVSAAGARAAGQPGLGRRPGLRPRLPRASLGAAPAGLDRPAPRPGRPDHVAAAGPHPAALGDVLRRGARGWSHRPALEVPPDPRRRQLDRRHRTGPARRRPRPASAGARGLGTEPRAEPGRSGARRGGRGADRAVGGDRHRPQHGRVAPSYGGRDRGPARCRRRRVVEPAARPPSTRSTSSRPSSAGWSSSGRRSRTTARSAGCTAAPSTTSSWPRSPVRSASWLMTRAEAVNAGRRLRALVPMSVIDEEREPTSLGSSVVGHLLNLPIGETSPVVRLHQVSYALQCAQRDRQGGRRRPDRGRRRLRADHVPRAGHAGRADQRPRRQPGDHQRAGSAVPDVRRRAPR